MGATGWRERGIQFAAIADNEAEVVSPPAVIPNVVCLADVTPEAVRWQWPGRIQAGQFALLVGRAGATTTFSMCDIAARISRGQLWPDGSGVAPTGHVVLIATEDGVADTLLPRLLAAGGDPNRVHVLRTVTRTGTDGTGTESPITPSDVEVITKAVDDIGDAVLIVVDPIGSHLGRGVDAHRDNRVRAALEPLARFAAERWLAVLLIAHSRKSFAGHADDNILGSRAFSALPRSILHLGPDPDDPERGLLLAGKVSNSRPPKELAFRLERVGDTARVACESDPVDLTADDLYAEGPQRDPGNRRGPRPTKLEEDKDWLEKAKANGSRPAQDLYAEAKDAGVAAKTRQKTSTELGGSESRRATSRAGGSGRYRTRPPTRCRTRRPRSPTRRSPRWTETRPSSSSRRRKTLEIAGSSRRWPGGRKLGYLRRDRPKMPQFQIAPFATGFGGWNENRPPPGNDGRGLQKGAAPDGHARKTYKS